jgi:hypothetical protein
MAPVPPATPGIHPHVHAFHAPPGGRDAAITGEAP